MFNFFKNKNKIQLQLQDIKDSDPEQFPKTVRAWSMPSMPYRKIYEIGMFDFESKKFINSKEGRFLVRNKYAQIQLFDRSIFALGRQYKFLHTGLVQVSLKALPKKGSNVNLKVALRDCRFLNFQDSLLGLVETSLSNGPVVFFNICPDFCVCLADHQFLTLDVEANGFEMLQESEVVEIRYRVYYKLMKSPFVMNPKCKLQYKKDSTILNEIDANKMTRRVINWKDVSIPERWVLPAEHVAENENEGVQKIETPERSSCDVSRNIDVDTWKAWMDNDGMRRWIMKS